MRSPAWNLFDQLCLMLFCAGSLFSQISPYQNDPYQNEKMEWVGNAPVVLPAEYSRFAAADVVILDDNTEFNFFAHSFIPSTYNGKVTRNLLVKLNTQKGVEQFKTLKLPESFDEGYEVQLYKQGRRTRITTPYTKFYYADWIMARKFANNQWSEVKLSDHYTGNRWIGGDGGFVDEDLANYELHDLKVGDIVQLYYESFFRGNYGNSIFYLTSRWPKLNCEYTFTYIIPKELTGTVCFFPMMIAPKAIKRSSEPARGGQKHTDYIELKNLAGVNYPDHSFEGRTLPHVCMSVDDVEHVQAVSMRGRSRMYTTIYSNPNKFDWSSLMDTNRLYNKVYDRHFESLRKFVHTLPPMGNDSMYPIFFKALCDTFNNFRYLSMNDLFYNKRELYEVSSGRHLLMRRLVGPTWPLYRDILDDAGVFYCFADVQDKRYGEHSSMFRANHVYDRSLVAIPNKSSYIFFMPRYEGLRYYLNELPFYYEDALGVLIPHNPRRSETTEKRDRFKFIRTGKGTYTDNARTENATVNISIDSLKADLSIRESLSGQFSTILRHLYLHTYIDSTIAPYYFKQCTDKPHSYAQKIQLSSHITEYPFRHSFNCSEKIELKNSGRFDLSDWFSFLLSEKIIPEPPNYDYYFDFQFSDSYNFLLNFDVPVEIANRGSFAKHISNEMFDLESSIEKNSDNSYLLKVSMAVKQSRLHYQEAGLLMELVKAMDELNHFSLELKKK